MEQLKIVPSKKDHIAIMDRSLGFIPKVLSGQKTIESRWYKKKTEPWDDIEKGDTIYFKNASEPVEAKAISYKVLQFENLTPVKVDELLDKYYKGIGLESFDIDYFKDLYKDKKYCILIFLESPQKVEPFKINKKGFGSMSAWITVNDINSIRIAN